ncbi:MAG: hypothetical protein PHO10_04715 [Gemmiger sp.]|nr:hypothetical protein [Gemmiger sp.]
MRTKKRFMAAFLTVALTVNLFAPCVAAQGVAPLPGAVTELADAGSVSSAENELQPTAEPVAEPEQAPTTEPAQSPEPAPDAAADAEPDVAPGTEPSAEPSVEPSAAPEATPTPEPAPTAEPEPTPTPTAEATPTPAPTDATPEPGVVAEATPAPPAAEPPAQTPETAPAPDAATEESAEPALYDAGALLTLAQLKDKGVTVTENPDGTTINIQTSEALIYLSNTQPSVYQRAKITFSETTALDGTTTAESYTFQGLGRADAPFQGEVASTSAVTFKLNRALFAGVSVQAQNTIVATSGAPITIQWPEDSPNPVLADAFVFDAPDTLAPTWDFSLLNQSYDEASAKSTSYAFGGLVGSATVADGITNTNALTLKTDLTASPANASGAPTGRSITQVTGGSDADVGLLCGKIGAGAIVNFSAVTLPKESYSVSGNNAGGLVGNIAAGGKLVSNAEAGVTLNTVYAMGSTTAGVLVGTATDAILELGKVTITGSGAAYAGYCGVLVGSYTYTGAEEKAWHTVDSNTFALENNSVVPTAGTGGGLFGKLAVGSADAAATPATFTIDCAAITGATTFNLSEGDGYTALAGGGLIGEYSAANLADTLTIKNTATPATAISSTVSRNKVETYGGLIASIGTNSYVEVDGLSVTTSYASGLNPTTYGGIAAKVGAGSVLKLSNVTANGPYDATGSGGGLVGEIGGEIGEGAALYLTGTTTMKGNTTAGTSTSHGQLVGKQTKSLVFAAKDWQLQRAAALQMDDIGNYGQVIRLGEFDADAPITFDANTHVISIASLNYASGAIALATKQDFAALAITLQTEGKFTAFPGENITAAALLGDTATNITMSGDIDMTNTGIQGLTRDDGSLTAFKGTFDGGSYTLTLPFGQGYGTGLPLTGNGCGQIYRHPYMGLFAKVDAATIKDVTVATPADTDYTGQNAHFYYTPTSGNAYFGAVAAYSTGNTTLNNVTTSVAIKLDTAKSTNLYAGGLVGYCENANTLTVTNCIGKASLSSADSPSKSENSRLGGLVGHINAPNSANIVFTDNTLSGAITSTYTGSRCYAGGLVATINSVNETNTAAPATLQIAGLTINKQTVAISASQYSGGLLGYECRNVNASLSGVNITNSTVTMNGNAHFGGLVYQAFGHWKIEKDATSGVGVSIASSTFTGNAAVGAINNNNTGKVDGLLVCNGYIADDKALYLEVDADAYIIDSTVTIKEANATCFDELVGSTKYNGESNKRGVVSINTGSTDGKFYTGTDDGTYVNKTKNANNDTPWVGNYYTRYYYNLDAICTDTNSATTPKAKYDLSDGIINTPQRLMAWSLAQYAATNLTSYFASSTITTGSYTLSNNLDMTGYPYYPVDPTTPIEIKDATITFDNATIEAKLKNKGTTTPPALLTSAHDSQHYGMHGGLLKDVNKNLTVNTLTLQGSVGKWSASGALICGNAVGSTTASLALSVNNVTLKDLYVNNATYTPGATDAAGYAPLLVNTIGSYTTASFTGVKTATAGGYYTTRPAGTAAASSLVGDVGSADATKIILSFSKMVLDGSTAGSIFSRATFLNSFTYSAESSGTYNFNEAEDWDDTGHTQQVTYGKEISTSTRNDGLQYCYYDTDNYVDPTNRPAAGTGENTNFKTDYRPYVYTGESSANKTHEIDVNLKKGDLIDGCGTYGHPYAINSATQLQTLASYFTSGKSPANWVVVYNAGSKFCPQGDTANDVYYQAVATDVAEVNQWVSGTYDANGIFTPDATPTTLTEADMRTYLQNAYYQIAPTTENHTLLLGKNFEGLGTTTYPFSGVIVGSNNDTTLELPEGSAYRGLVNVSYGSVVKGLNIRIAPLTVDKSSDTTTTANNVYFGGVIGDVKGGDNIIDAVTVTYGSTGVTLTGANARHATVGGYVGLVEAGGVIFKNMTDASGLTTITESAADGLTLDGNTNAALETSTFYYANPYVGRVLDGFAVYVQGTGSGTAATLPNTDKNYKVPTLTGGTGDLTVDAQNKNIKAGEITVNNAEGLFILSAIVNSGAGANGYFGNQYYETDSYNIGKVRNAKYDGVGKIATADADADFKISQNDDTRYSLTQQCRPSQKVSYLVTNYTTSAENSQAKPAACLVSGSNTRYILTLAAEANLDMTSYGNGFRGIGVRYKKYNGKTEIFPTPSVETTSVDRGLIFIYQLEGNSNTVTTAITAREYSGDAYQTAGVGLFTRFQQNGLNTTKVANLTLSGTVSLTVANAANGKPTTGAGQTYASVGGFAGLMAYYNGRLDGVSTFENIKLVDLAVSGGFYAGGLFGRIGQTDYKLPLQLTDCQYTHLDISADYAAGGFVGCTYSDLTVTNSKNFTEYTGNTANIQIGVSDATNGAGGIVGYASVGALTVGSSDTPQLKLSNLTVSADLNNIVSGVGGIVGQASGNTTLKNTAITDVKIYGVTSGRYSLTLLLKQNYEKDSGTCGSQAGGAVGRISGGFAALDAIQVYSTVEPISTQNNAVEIFSDSSAGGLVGACYGSTELTIKNSSAATQGSGRVLIISTRSAQGAGGVLGYNNKTANITGCTVGHPTATNLLILNSTEDAGGVLGKAGYNTNSTIASTTVQNAIMVSLRAASGVVAEANSPIAITDTTIKNCAILTITITSTTSSDRVCGALVGNLKNKSLSGSNILWADNKIGYYTKNGTDVTGPTAAEVENWEKGTDFPLGLANVALPTPTGIKTYDAWDYAKDTQVPYSIGTWVGTVGTTTAPIQLTGVSLQCSGVTSSDGKTIYAVPQLEIGNKENTGDSTYNGYIVYADYTGAATATGANTTDKAPYVTTNPSTGHTLQDDSTNPPLLTGDAACFTTDSSGGTTSISRKILEDYTANKTAATKNYTTYAGAAAFAEYYQGAVTDGKESDKLSTYAALQGSGSTALNMPVLLVDKTATTIVTQEINSYLDLLTNGGYSRFAAAQAASGGNQNFVTATQVDVSISGSTVTLTKNANGIASLTRKWVGTSTGTGTGNDYPMQYSVTPGQYDNNQSRFTLLEVAFGSYTLRVPIIVQRIVEGSYSITLQNGTVFDHATYTDLSDRILLSYREKATAYLHYTYQYDWLPELENGGSLLWGYDKTITFGVAGTVLPQGTKLTLIDVAGGDAAYTYTINDAAGRSSVKMSEFVGADGKPWAPQPLAGALSLEATDTTAETPGVKWVVTTNTTEATVKIGGTYYKKASAEDTTGLYTITRTADAADPSESYYLVLETPAKTTAETGIKLSFSAPPTQHGTDAYLPHRLKQAQRDQEYTGNIYSALEQSLGELETTKYSNVNTLGNTITATITDTITPDKNYLDFLPDSHPLPAIWHPYAAARYRG